MAFAKHLALHKYYFTFVRHQCYKENGTFLNIFGKTDYNFKGHVQYNLNE